MRSFVKLSVVVGLFLFVSAQSSSADWMDNWIARELKGRSLEDKRLTDIDTEVQSILLELRVTSEKYHGFANEIGYIHPMNYKDACKKFRDLNPGSDVAKMKKQAARVVEILKVADDLVMSGKLAPERLRKVLSDGRLPSVMGKVIDNTEKLQKNCRMK